MKTLIQRQKQKCACGHFRHEHGGGKGCAHVTDLVMLEICACMSFRLRKERVLRSQSPEKACPKVRRWEIECGETESLGTPYVRMSEAKEGKYVLFEDFLRFVLPLKSSRLREYMETIANLDLFTHGMPVSMARDALAGVKLAKSQKGK